MGTRSTDAAQLMGAGMLSAAAPELMSQMSVLWVLAAMGICTIADSMVPAGAGRGRVAVRYLASVAVTLAASYAASAAVEIYFPEWRGHVWAVRFGAAVLVGIVLHPVIAAAPRVLAQVPRLVADFAAAVIDRFRGRRA